MGRKRIHSITAERSAPVATSRPCSCPLLPSSPSSHLSGGLVIDPRPADVFLGRGKGSYERRGNKAYMEIITSYLPAYVDSKGNKDKTRITEDILALVKKNGGRFLGVDPSSGLVHLVSDADARMKVSQALRHQRLAREKKKKKRKHVALEKEYCDGMCRKRTVNEENEATGQGIQRSKCADVAVPVAHEGSADVARNYQSFLLTDVASSQEEGTDEYLYWCNSSERNRSITNPLIYDEPIDTICDGDDDDDLFAVLSIDMDNDLELIL